MNAAESLECTSVRRWTSWWRQSITRIVIILWRRATNVWFLSAAQSKLFRPVRLRRSAVYRYCFNLHTWTSFGSRSNKKALTWSGNDYFNNEGSTISDVCFVRVWCCHLAVQNVYITSWRASVVEKAQFSLTYDLDLHSGKLQQHTIHLGKCYFIQKLYSGRRQTYRADRSLHLHH